MFIPNISMLKQPSRDVWRGHFINCPVALSAESLYTLQRRTKGRCIVYTKRLPGNPEPSMQSSAVVKEPGQSLHLGRALM